jgi:hypothetical protein
MKCKFNLEKALAGEPVVTRSGDTVEIIRLLDTTKLRYPLMISVLNNYDYFTIEGYCWEGSRKSDLDLFMYVNFFKLLKTWVRL